MLKLPAVEYVDEGDWLRIKKPRVFRGMIDGFLSTLHGWVQVTLSKPGKPRTTGPGSQNHHLGGHIDQLACAAGISSGTMKTYIKTRAALELGYPTEEFDGKQWAKSEADSSTIECGLLIDMCHIVASEKGYALFEKEGWYNP